MKKITLVALMFLATLSIAQEKENAPIQDVGKSHEVKMNAISLIGFKWVDVSYEYLIDEESSFGTSVLFSLDGQRDIDVYKNFSITPYYRRYFSNKYARGFFIEGFGMLNTFREDFMITCLMEILFIEMINKQILQLVFQPGQNL